MLGQATGLEQKRVGKAIPLPDLCLAQLPGCGNPDVSGFGGWKRKGPQCEVRGALSRRPKKEKNAKQAG